MVELEIGSYVLQSNALLEEIREALETAYSAEGITTENLETDQTSKSSIVKITSMPSRQKRMGE